MTKEKRTINFKYNLKEYFNLIKPHRWAFIFILFLVFIIEGGYVLGRYLFKVLIDNGTEFTAGNLGHPEFVTILLIIAGVYLFIGTLNAVLKLIKFKILIKVTTNSIADLKRKYFNHIIQLSHKFHTNHKTGSLISRVLRGGHAIDGLNDVIVFNVAPMFFELIITSASVLYFNTASAIVIILTSIVFVGYSVIVQNKSKQWADEYNQTEDIEKGMIGDIMTNIDSVKYFGKENLIKSKFKKISENTKNAAAKFWNYFGIMDLGQSIILSLGVFFLVLFPVRSLLRGEMSIGTLVFIYTVFGNVVGNLFGFVHGIRQYYKAMIDFEDLFQYGKIENDIIDNPKAKKLEIKKGEIEFKDLGFKYHKHKLFENFNLDIKKNQKVALVGHSGCGKTTLIKLLYRFYDLDGGQITIDGKDIRSFKQESLRSELSIVPQEAVLFDDTIYNNIAFSNPKATEKQVFEAMKFAQLDKIIASFPDKEKTIVGERGVKLSGGEKQRVSIARAILANKKVLVLDEATSALDSETEYEIQKDLKRLMEGRTSIIIAHRLSTIMHADKIVVMDKGKIIQMGKHTELIKKFGPYRKLWDLQKGGYIK